MSTPNHRNKHRSPRQRPGWAPTWLRCAWQHLHRWLGQPPDIPPALWQHVLQAHPFLHHLTPAEHDRLRTLCQGFLASKEFHGAQGLRISDDMALGIAAQACLPLLHWGPNALDWYSDFVGIVVHPDEVVAQREVTDAAGVVHRYREALAGEAMEHGPVMLVWSHVASAAHQAGAGRNVVIHEFAHKLDMHGKPRGQGADGCPHLPWGLPCQATARDAYRHWRHTLYEAHAAFQRQVEMAERFGAPPPWLDSYGAQSPVEFFAVACEAYFVNRARFSETFPALLTLFDAFFRPHEPGF